MNSQRTSPIATNPFLEHFLVVYVIRGWKCDQELHLVAFDSRYIRYQSRYAVSCRRANDWPAQQDSLQFQSFSWKKVLQYLLERDLFEISKSLLNLKTGEVADNNVSVYKAHEIGESIILKMSGISVYDHSFTRKDMPITMKSKSSVNTVDILVEVDPQLFFQRLIIFIQPD